MSHRLRRLSRGGLTLLAAALLAVAGSVDTAWAHALLLRADPAADVLLPAAPASIHLWFSEDLNGSASRIVVWDRYRHIMNQGDATLVPGQPRQLEVKLKPLPPGAYLVLWTSVSAQDGHILRGAYLFYVQVRGPGPSVTGVSFGSGGQGFPDTAGLVSLVAHWLELLAAIVWVGAAAFSALIYSGAARRLDGGTRMAEFRRVRRLMWASLLLLIAASTVVLLLQAYSLAGNDWGKTLSRTTLLDVFAGQYGQVWVGRQVVALIALALTVAIRPRPDRAQPWSEGVGAMLVVGAIYLYALAASGHAASAAIGTLPGHHGNIFSVAIFLDWLHFVGVALWFGGQIYIALVLIPALRLRREDSCNTRPFLDTLDRFSPFAYGSIAIFIFTGGFNGKIHIPSWYAFFNSVYGRALIVKMLLIGLMMLTSAYTVYLVRPRLRRDLAAAGSMRAPERGAVRHLLSWLHVEPFLGAGVLLATSVMYSYPVPPGLAPAGPSTYTAQESGLTATVSIKPDRSGPNQITVSLRDAQGRPVSQAHVSVLTTMLDMVMGTGVASLQATSPGTFTGTTDLGMGGRWQLQLLVYRPNGFTRLFVKVQVGT